MNIVTRVNANVPNRILRRLKFKIYQLQRKFNFLISANLYIDTEGFRNKVYQLKLVFAVPGMNLVLRDQGPSLEVLVEKNIKNAHRLLAKHK